MSQSTRISPITHHPELQPKTYALESKDSNKRTVNSMSQPVISDDLTSSSGLGLPKILQDFRELVKKGLPLDHSTLAAVIDAIRHNDSLDDRKLLLEHILAFLARLPSGSVSQSLQNKVIVLLYNDLTHPPATYIGNKYKFRTADGSNNNILSPDMGKAGTPYARSVQQSNPLPGREMPDAGLIFDTLLKRDGFVKHPGGLSSLMFAFAALVVHTVFRTSRHDISINETSSYVDLAPLYGHNEASQSKVRKYDGYGKLHNDVFAEDRLMLLPPAVCALLVLFCRNHNYIAQKLFEVNESGAYLDPLLLSAAAALKQDEELFQTARLVNCGWFGNVVFSDYFSCILGLVREGSSWSLNPFGEFRKDDHSLFERGEGNVCSVEFNCLYRWHATTSAKDETWVNDLMDDMFDGKAYDEISLADFKVVGKKLSEMDPDVTRWTFGHMVRRKDGYFKDEDLAKILHDATDEPAAAFRARGTPPSMRLHEILGIEQNRHWGVCSLNDFRKFLGLRPFSTFLEWNSDPNIAFAAEKLYGNIDSLELYVGLQAEEAKPLVDGAGLCPGYTISRAILSDAIALTRGDRFFTRDFTPANLTAWGFADCQRDPNAFGFGGALGKLFLRTLPCEFGEDGNNVYAFFPLMTPQSMKVHLTKMGLEDQYGLKRPVKKEATASVGSKQARKAANVLEAEGKGFYIVENNEERRRVVLNALIAFMGSEDKIGQYFYAQTITLMSEQSFCKVGCEKRVIDIVRDVLKPLTIGFVATEVAGISLTKGSHRGSYTPLELYDILGNIYECILLDVEGSRLVNLQQKVRHDVKHLANHFRYADKFSIVNFVENAFWLYGRGNQGPDINFAKRLVDLGIPGDEVTNTILAVMVGASVELSLALTNVVNICLRPESRTGDIESRVRGAMREDPTFRGASIGLEPALDGNMQQEIFGLSQCLGESLTMKILSETLRAVCSYPGICRGPGQSGVLCRFKIEDNVRRQLRYGYLDNNKKVSPWPTSLMLQFDESLEDFIDLSLQTVV
ncbi:linoleate diol synthase [Desarmillaria tabescens]|uniref:Linoleate diol synthase n=1 Tax=Armillaria tabescens TaxID=1929756 RepID=A0AA39NPB8_ARMTA|nr:linoleate diol synthase [Desarmillaria tabescens]KAK0469345.1 linoleate diol synthase [Desarmillaria tabescens]